MKLIRTYARGLYEVYAANDGTPWLMAPARLDTTLSLGTGRIGAAGRQQGLRDDDAVIERQIARYAEAWRNTEDPPHPTILVLGEAVKGTYQPTPTVIDGAMWVAAAVDAGLETVPVYMVVPTLPGIDRREIWLYFNTITNGVPVSERVRRALTKEFATAARRAGVTDREVTEDGRTYRPSDLWIREYARATATPVSVVRQYTAAIFATRRTDKELQEDAEAHARGESIGEIARKRKRSKAAIRKALQRLQRQERTGQAAAPAPAEVASTNGHKGHDQEDATLAAESILAKIRPLTATGQAQAAIDRMREAAPTAHALIQAIEQLVAYPADRANGASMAQRLPLETALDIWATAIGDLHEELMALADHLKLYKAPAFAARYAKWYVLGAHAIMETLHREKDPELGRLRTLIAQRRRSEQLPLKV